MLALVTEVTSNDLNQYLAGVPQQQDIPVVTIVCHIRFLVEYLRD